MRPAFRHAALALALSAGALALSACDTIEAKTDATGRDLSARVVAEVVATRIPGIPNQLVSPAIECVVHYAQAKEVRSLAKAAITGIDESTVTTVTDIMRRPDTVACMREKVPQSVLGAIF